MAEVRDVEMGRASERAARPRSIAELSRVRAALVVALTLVTGVTDAIGFTKLGGVFTSVMTGNMVLLGVAAGRSDGTLAIHTGVAFAGYVAGSFVGARIAGQASKPAPLWPRALTITLAVELATFALFAAGWEAAGAAPTGNVALGLLCVNAAALGIQSAAILRLGISGLSTTYLTGTLTTVIAALAARTPVRHVVRSIAVLAALILGAAIGATLAIHVPAAAPLGQLVILAAVIAVAVAVFWRAGDHAPEG